MSTSLKTAETSKQEGGLVWQVGRFNIHIMPRASMNREQFLRRAGRNTVALDGVVLGGPFVDVGRKVVNFDHHDSVVREATMSTAKQVHMAIKLGLMNMFGEDEIDVYMNDTDQDSTLAAYILVNHKKFEGQQSLPNFNRLMALTDVWDITGGAYPINLDDVVVRQHNWVFGPYNDLRKSGQLATATATQLRDNLEAMFGRLNKFVMGQSGESRLDTRHEILHQSDHFWLVHEIGGSEARYHLCGLGMKAFIAIVAVRPDGRRVLSIGRRSQYIPFPVEKIYDRFNKMENLPPGEGCGGSSIIGGSSRLHGCGLTNEQIIEAVEELCREANL